MKKLAILAIVATLSACATSSHNDEPMVGMANPASVFCEKQGGQSINRKNTDGSEYGVCVFSNGSEINEWDYFRANHAK
ncbi:putative hemolysin [Wielerella bovis]|uniref:putative hemolysin n=1 Tax=Wielerella bovis TaxID=2917790 RepID=UPI002018892B|nr:DUF333 domain-containing protein [Wielerella bovis]MCG7656964.1 DUF333 domain-containing protein [Wielerella bovis]MCG7659187.1 DUF333 domain-containing protein [Wielerella bovis]